MRELILHPKRAKILFSHGPLEGHLFCGYLTETLLARISISIQSTYGATLTEKMGEACLLFFAHLQHRQERFLRNVDFADALHPLLAFLLLFEQLALAADVSAVALGNNVLADRGHR